MIKLKNNTINKNFKIEDIVSFDMTNGVGFISQGENNLVCFWDDDIAPEVRPLNGKYETLQDLIVGLNLCELYDIVNVATTDDDIEVCINYIKNK